MNRTAKVETNGQAKPAALTAQEVRLALDDLLSRLDEGKLHAATPEELAAEVQRTAALLAAHKALVLTGSR